MRNSHLARVLAYRAAQETTPVYERALKDQDGASCSVYAFHYLTGVDWVEAHRALKSIGRRSGYGLVHGKLDQYLALFAEYGFSTTRVDSVRPGPGRYLILSTDHATAWIDGQPINGLSRRSRILYIFRVEPA